MHTYLRVSDIGAVYVHGLNGLSYRDSANGNVERIETSDAVRFDGEVDRIYFNSSAAVTMQDSKRLVRCTAQGIADAVVWNPGAALSQKLADMDDDGYRYMVCVEAAAIASPIILRPGETWQGTQVLVVKS